ncbi:hypothetical protein GCK72_018547 [Caenorhabditis remanei]|uniref:Uncharacterized protein n=1 Tax=Caenorhabditis remanei TaxID=31234 RepID=A0A6A5GBE4_CAERE|nr:hypothetical protein GCK72_018547 [Caenorhabditis remanei]KAF1751993.1 hypothetical protein GCK72_018547 [Caenorhabditis remanei]
MDSPSCSKITSTDSAEFDLPELLSVTQNEHRSSSSESPAPVRHLRPTECSICGKTANGYHYDVPSCNGCKTFFRRLCISEKHFACKANGDCFDLTKRATPNKCRACRYEKCISAGMNPMAMQVDEKEATAGNFKKLTKRVNRSASRDSEDEDEDHELQIEKMTKKQVIKNIATIENKMQRMVETLSYLESKVRNFRMSAYNPDWKKLPGLEGFLIMANQISIADKSGPMPGWPMKAQSPPPKPPNFAMQKGPQYSPDKKQWLLYDLMVTIEYAKTFMFFHRLDIKDRLILMRYVTLALMNLHISYFSMLRKFDTVIHPDGSQPPMKLGMVYTEVVMSISPLIRCEIQEAEFVLLKAICLCNPAVPDLSPHAQEILAKEREQYAEALFDHCLRNRKDGLGQFAELIGMVDLLERQQRMQKDLHLLHVAPFVAHIPPENKMRLIDDIMNS